MTGTIQKAGAAPAASDGFIGRSFLNTADFSGGPDPGTGGAGALAQAGGLPAAAGRAGHRHGLLQPVAAHQDLAGAPGVARLGGTTIDLPVGQSTYAFEFSDGVVMDGATQEHINEAAPVLSQYCDAIAVRSSELITRGDAVGDAVGHLGRGAAGHGRAQLRQIRHRAGNQPRVEHVPPVPGVGRRADAARAIGPARRARSTCSPGPTTPSRCPPPRRTRSCWPPATWAATSRSPSPKAGIWTPRSWPRPQPRAAQAGGSLTISHDQDEAAQDADIDLRQKLGRHQPLRRLGAGEGACAQALQGLDRGRGADGAHQSTARFMHCLPVRRNVVVTDGVLDGPSSIVVAAGRQPHVRAERTAGQPAGPLAVK